MVAKEYHTKRVNFSQVKNDFIEVSWISLHLSNLSHLADSFWFFSPRRR